MRSRELPYVLPLFLLPAAVVVAVVWHQPWLAFLAPCVILLLGIAEKPAYLFFALCLTIPLSAELQLLPGLGTDVPDEPLMWLNTVVVFFLWVQQRQKQESVLFHPIVALVMLLWVWSWVSMVANGGGVLAAKYILAKTWYIIPFLFGSILFLNTTQRLRTLVICIVVPMIILCGITLIRHAMIGFSFAKVNDASTPYFRNHVNYGALLVCCIPPAYAMYRATRNRWWLAGMAVLLAGLCFSYSRGAWLALPAGLLAAWLVKRRWMVWAMGVMLILVVSSSAWLLHNNRYLAWRPDFATTIYHTDFRDHMEATYAMKDLSTAERLYRWIAAWRMGVAHPVTGVGPNQFYPAYRSYTVESFRTYVSDNPEHSTVHNYFLLMLSEQGFPALVMFALLLMVMMYTAQRMYHRINDTSFRAIILTTVSVLAMITVLISLSDLIEADKMGSVFYICAGILVLASSGAYVQRIPEAVSQKVE